MNLGGVELLRAGSVEQCRATDGRATCLLAAGRMRCIGNMASRDKGKAFLAHPKNTHEVEV